MPILFVCFRFPRLNLNANIVKLSRSPNIYLSFSLSVSWLTPLIKMVTVVKLSGQVHLQIHPEVLRSLVPRMKIMLRSKSSRACLLCSGLRSRGPCWRPCQRSGRQGTYFKGCPGNAGRFLSLCLAAQRTLVIALRQMWRDESSERSIILNVKQGMADIAWSNPHKSKFLFIWCVFLPIWWLRAKLKYNASCMKAFKMHI